MVALGRGLPRPSRNDLIIGVLWSGVYNFALNAGEQRVDAGTAVMLIQVSPVLIAFLAALFLNERFTAYLALGLALAFGGVALIAFSASPGGNSDVVGVLLCLIAAVVYSVSLILQKPLMGRMQAVHVTWLSCTVGAISCLPFTGQLASEVGDGQNRLGTKSSTVTRGWSSPRSLLVASKARLNANLSAPLLARSMEASPGG